MFLVFFHLWSFAKPQMFSNGPCGRQWESYKDVAKLIQAMNCNIADVFLRNQVCIIVACLLNYDVACFLSLKEGAFLLKDQL